MRPQGHLELLSKEEGCVVLLWRHRVLLQVRRGELTTAMFARIRKASFDAASSGEPMGALFVVEAGAPIAPDDVRQVQRTFVTELAAHTKARLASVMLGDDVQSTLHRSVARLVAAGSPNLQRFETLAPGATWLARELTQLGVAVKPSELVAMIEHLRQMGSLFQQVDISKMRRGRDKTRAPQVRSRRWR